MFVVPPWLKQIGSTHSCNPPIIAGLLGAQQPASSKEASPGEPVVWLLSNEKCSIQNGHWLFDKGDCTTFWVVQANNVSIHQNQTIKNVIKFWRLLKCCVLTHPKIFGLGWPAVGFKSELRLQVGCPKIGVPLWNPLYSEFPIMRHPFWDFWKHPFTHTCEQFFL